MDSRTIAARILARVMQAEITVDSAYTELIPATTSVQDRAYIKELCYGVLRWFYRLEFILDRLTDKPIRRKDSDVRAIILCGLYQLGYMRTPAHAAVSASVDAAVHLNKSWAKKLINAVLRRYQREATEIEQQIQYSETACYAHPQWLIAAVRTDWPECWQKILDANNQRPPMYLRVNLQKIQRDNYLQMLKDTGIEATAVDGTTAGIRLSAPADIDALPGFSAGLVSVQDIGAQRAVTLLDLQAGQRVLDACAAPGGKTGHIHETQPALAGLDAVEKDHKRLLRLMETKQRLAMKADIYHADAVQYADWWNGRPYDRILVDAPCSATGVIRRHPDIKLLRHAETIGKYCELQGKLLSVLWSMLNNQGRLVYATCSVLAAENDRQIEIFLNKFPNAENIDIMTRWGTKTEYGVQTLPGVHAGDGFYYAVMVKH